MKNLFYREKEAREVLEYDYKQLAYECEKHMELCIASDRDLVNCCKSLQKLNEDCEKLRAQLKELEEAALPIARLQVPHPSGPKIAPLVDRLREAPSRLATYVKHLAKSIPNQVLAFMKSYFLLTPKFGKESDLWVQLGEKSFRRKEGFFRCIRQKNPRSAICFRSARKLLS
jgi:hypothetical protein